MCCYREHAGRENRERYDCVCRQSTFVYNNNCVCVHVCQKRLFEVNSVPLRMLD